jgi:hypothetical protein
MFSESPGLIPHNAHSTVTGTTPRLMPASSFRLLTQRTWNRTRSPVRMKTIVRAPRK